MIKARLKLALDAAIGALTAGMLNTVKLTDRRRMANFAGWLMRTVGPIFFKEHQIGRDNLRAAFPEKPDAEIERILSGVWDNLGRLAIEFAHLDEFQFDSSGQPAPNTVILSPETRERYERIRKNGKAVIGFASHLANWEISGVVVHSLGFNSAVLYRRPNIRSVNDIIVRLRTPQMGELVPTGLDAPVRLARHLQSGRNVGMLADQHFTKGVEVTFFGRRCLANPLVALLARQTGCPIHGLRCARLPDPNSFWGEITDEVEPVRDAEGRVDVKGTTQRIAAMIEGWIREHPEQWLWLHRRWR